MKIYSIYWQKKASIAIFVHIPDTPPPQGKVKNRIPFVYATQHFGCLPKLLDDKLGVIINLCRRGCHSNRIVFDSTFSHTFSVILYEILNVLNFRRYAHGREELVETNARYHFCCYQSLVIINCTPAMQSCNFLNDFRPNSITLSPITIYNYLKKLIIWILVWGDFLK